MELEEYQLKAIMWDDDAGFDYTLIDHSEWEDQGKFQTCEIVFRNNEDGKHYMFSPTRTGNHWSGYEIEIWDEDVWEVALREVVVRKWLPVEGLIWDITQDII